MTQDEVDTVLAWLAEGRVVRVPINAPLFSDNHPLSSSVRREASGRYVLETLFKEQQTIREEEPVQLSSERRAPKRPAKLPHVANTRRCSIAVLR
jgi:hypothetical protein